MKTYNLYREKMFKEVFYGSGDGDYIVELISDYIKTNECYGKKEVTFIIREVKWFS